MKSIPSIHLPTWNPNDPCFGGKRPCSWGLTFKNRGLLRVPGRQNPVILVERFLEPKIVSCILRKNIVSY